ncbi:MAG: tetratricopeptide repeat protein [Gammaproteobacteria bacterium]|nr:tetratricopeptide repeat protein [Gammaproteobacteria bacterium]
MSRNPLSVGSSSLSLLAGGRPFSVKQSKTTGKFAKLALYAIGPCVGAAYLLASNSPFLGQNEASGWTNLKLPAQPTISIMTRDPAKSITTEIAKPEREPQTSSERTRHNAASTSQRSIAATAKATVSASSMSRAAAEEISAAPIVQATIEIEKHLRPLSNEELAGEAWQKGLQKLSAGDTDGAIERFRHALALQPDHIEARWSLAATLINQSNLDEADVLLAKGIELTHNAPRLAQLYAHLLLSRGHPEKALKILDTAPPPVKDDTEYHALLASILVREGQHARAANIYGSLLAVDSSKGVWWLGLGVCAEALAKPMEAVTAYERAAGTGLNRELNNIVLSRLAALKAQTNTLAQTEGYRP